MPRYIIFYLLLFVVLSFKSIDGTNDKQLLGRWLLLQQNTIICRACPEVQFFSNLTGQLASPSGEVYNFTWKVDGKLVHLSYEDKDHKKLLFFRATKFSYKVKKGKRTKLLLTSKDTKLRFVLYKKVKE